ncbi:MAG TPA: FAD-dependent oxidoreductase [Casimicrobiaceae bacterium]|nr:FAD-dependent oxidoreductase [Casimicrobiaceae bacterium]
MKTYTHPVYPYVKPAELAGGPRHWPVIVAGAGPVGLVAAIDLAQRGIDVLVLDEDDTVSVGSRAICWSKRTLEILDRLGCGEHLVKKGVGWSVGRVFFHHEQVYQFDLLPEQGHRRPAFINLQQYYVEQFLVARLAEHPDAELRWRHKVVGVSPQADRVAVRIATQDGEYSVYCDWLIVADGSKSAIRTMLGLESEGQVFHDRFLIADIHMRSNFPAERWFWFDPPFHPHQSALLHRQADNVWRVDFQLGPDADPEEEKKPERILPRLRAMLGEKAEFEIEWASVYTFQCRRMRSFRHGRVLFAGDAAHIVSPFGARGANGGIQDVDNLAWKLELVLEELAPPSLLDSYDIERTFAADENIRNSTRSTDFITPKSAVSRSFRDAALMLAKRCAFARKLVNSGRLSLPATLSASPLNTADTETFAGEMQPGAPAADAPVAGPAGVWLLDYVGDGFTLLVFGAELSQETLRELTTLGRTVIPCRTVLVDATTSSVQPGVTCILDASGSLKERYDARPGTAYLFRPDQHVCARWRALNVAQVQAAIARATGQHLH